MSNKKRITVVVNKAWEYELFFNAITNSVLRAEGLPKPTDIAEVIEEPMKVPRAKMDFINSHVTFRCVQNMMDANVNKSNSEAKMKYMPEYLSSDNPDLVISVSTAESTPELASALGQSRDTSMNGSVIIGNRFFMSDQRSLEGKDPESKLDVKKYAQYYDKLFDILYRKINAVSGQVVKKFIPQKNAPAPKMFLYASDKLASVGVVNIVHYEKYSIADEKSLEDFHQSKIADTPACLETTHGIVSMAANPDNGSPTIPVIFVSPITDRYLQFSSDVDDVQNYVAAFNAGIAVGEILVLINNLFHEN